MDYGDLPPQYGVTLFAEDGARHPVGVYYLGAGPLEESVDAEINGSPSLSANGDDNDNKSDEDGIVVDDLKAGTVAHVQVTASLFGGYLQGWIDFNGNGNFDDLGERIFTNELLIQGVNELTFDVPATFTDGDVFARFRYGEYGIDSVTGAALIGEVEDYLLDKAAPVVVSSHGPDFNDDGDVNGFDFLLWQRGHGNSGAAVVSSDGDSNNDDVVNGADLADWEAEYGSTAPAAVTAPVTDDDNNDGGSDLLASQIEVGSISASVVPSDEENTDDVVAATVEDSNETEVPVLSAVQTPQQSSSPVMESSITLAATVPTQQVAESSVVNNNVVFAAALAPVETISAPTRVVTLAGDVRQGSSQNDAMIALSRQVRSAGDLGLSQEGRRSLPARFEHYSTETRIDRVGYRDAVNDRVMDRFVGVRQRPMDETGERTSRGRDLAKAALAEVLDEEINWRFF